MISKTGCFLLLVGGLAVIVAVVVVTRTWSPTMQILAAGSGFGMAMVTAIVISIIIRKK